MPAEPRQGPRWPAFDGLRAVAVLMVIAYHLEQGAHIPGGYAGVNVFFVLSGFLITSLLIDEYRARGGVDLKAFWMRRVVRLAPALLVTVIAAVALAVAGVQAAQPHATLVGLPFVLFYVGNYVRAFNQNALGILGHTWSLSVEEQFYLLWPPLLIWALARRPRYGWQILAALAILDAIWGHIETVAISEARGNFSTDTDAYGLLAGCALAVWYSGWRKPLTSRAWRAGLQTLSVLAVAGAGATLTVAETTYTMTPQVAAITVCTVAVLGQILVAPGGPLQAVLESRPAQWIGKRSYAFYLYHYLIVQAWTYDGHGLSATGINMLKLCLTAVAAGVSWRWLEQPVQRRFKPRWMRRRGAIQLTPPQVELGSAAETAS